MKYKVTGMHCAACSSRVEKAVSKVEGVRSCSVNLLTNSMTVEGSADRQEIIFAVEKAGYGARLTTDGSAANSVQSISDREDYFVDEETPALKKRLIVSGVFLLVLMYFSMGTMMWGFPLPSWLEGNHIAMGLVQLVLSAVIMVINQQFFIRGFSSLFRLSPNMDSLVALGSMTSFLWSLFVLFQMTGAAHVGSEKLLMEYMDNFYFESAAMILTLITVGKMLEAKSKGKTTNALKALMKLAPKEATVLRDGIEIRVPIEQVKVGDIFLVKAGESMAVDGIILEGSGAINEASLTGESIPVDKSVGDDVWTGTINMSGFLKCQAIKVGKDTALAKIIDMVSEASSTKAPIAKTADKVSGVFVPIVIGISLVTIAVWIFVGETLGFALARGISVLVISCPCALGLATPVAIMVGNGVAAKRGILFKTALAMEETGRANIIVLDKTGTITKGQPQVTDILVGENFTEKDLLKFSSSLEIKSEHPLGKAIVEKQGELKIDISPVEDFQVLAGRGLTGIVEGKTVIGGNLEFLEENICIGEDIKDAAMKFAEEGKTPMFFALNDKFLGIIAVADTLKEDSPRAIEDLKKMGLEVIMLTGDNERTAKAIGKMAGVDRVIAGVKPDGKEKAIRKLGLDSKVIMVGDGINDAPALTRADIGMAIGAGTDIAIDAADVVLMKSTLSDGAFAIKLSRGTLKNIHENLFWAFFYNVIGIPLAAGVWIPIFGWTLNPMFGALAMSLSSFCVVTNALRLNRYYFK